jgi:F-type H+-transporting ATPase subunit a
MAAEGHAPTAGEYIVHHLTHLQSKKQTSIIDFSVFNLDSIFFSIVLGLLGSFLLWKAAKAATSGVPGRFQAAVEMLVRDGRYPGQGHHPQRHSRKLVAPFGADRVCLDLPSECDGLSAGGSFPLIGRSRCSCICPTCVWCLRPIFRRRWACRSRLLICLYYNVKIKGLGGWFHELTSAPFGDHPILWPFNFVMQMIEFVAKTVSHGMRLFGNMYAGELIFMLIALMGGAAALP